MYVFFTVARMDQSFSPFSIGTDMLLLLMY